MTHPILNDPRLPVLLDCLLPGGAGFPPAAALHLSRRIAESGRLAEALAALLDVLPSGVDQSALETAEADHPAIFGSAIVAAYSAYYTHPDVLAVIERATGYMAGPPQPDGYALPPFDPAMLAVPAARAPHWRDPRAPNQGSPE